ncbi:MAG: hypothetical protein LBI92_05705 [Azoarcus sp.]|jgi:hypothetical protein|nr:hypothetical protein [Azoarcus sp.]
MISGLSFPVASPLQSASAYAGARREQDGATATDSARPGQRGSANELSEAERRRLEEMKVTDRKVRAHEAAHMAAGGSLVTSGASFGYETGPDGQKYAVSGEVGIDTSKGRTPQETLVRAAQIRAAALAPADPSPQDRSVAAAASQMAAEARAEIARENMEKMSSGAGGTTERRASAFGQAIANSLAPTSGRALDIYA